MDPKELQHESLFVCEAKAFELAENDETQTYSFLAYSGDYVDFGGHKLRFDVETIDLARHENNPVFLWSHNSEEPIGTVEIKKQDGKLVGIATFDESDFRSRWAKGKVDAGTVKAVSIGVKATAKTEIVEDDDEHLTVTHVELLELSLCSIPRDEKALRFSLSEKDVNEMAVEAHFDLENIQKQAEKPELSLGQDEIDELVSLAEGYQKAIETLEGEKAEMSSHNTKLDCELETCKTQLAEKDKVITDLTQQVKEQEEKLAKRSLGLGATKRDKPKKKNSYLEYTPFQ